MEQRTLKSRETTSTTSKTRLRPSTNKLMHPLSAAEAAVVEIAEVSVGETEDQAGDTTTARVGTRKIMGKETTILEVSDSKLVFFSLESALLNFESLSQVVVTGITTDRVDSRDAMKTN
jgi:hypothetical protein